VKLLSLALFLVACQNTPSQLEGKTTGGGASKGDSNLSELVAAAKRLDERLAKFEALHKPDPGAGSTLERLHRIEVGLARREEALGFLEMAYAQQKQQQEAQEANEPDPNAVFAVDISKAVAAGQVDGPTSAMVTIVEAWDFA
jgi:ABC-type phosphate transport system substrate-binding protein